MTYDDFFNMFSMGDPVGAGIAGGGSLLSALQAYMTSQDMKRDVNGGNVSDWLPPTRPPAIDYAAAMAQNGVSARNSGPGREAYNLRMTRLNNDDYFKAQGNYLSNINALRAAKQAQNTAKMQGVGAGIGAYGAFRNATKNNNFMRDWMARMGPKQNPVTPWASAVDSTPFEPNYDYGSGTYEALPFDSPSYRPADLFGTADMDFSQFGPYG
jgi:hypothetical protein